MVSFNSIVPEYASDLLHLIRGLPVRGIIGPMEVAVRSVVEDSRVAGADSAFFVLPGERSHGSQFTAQAIDAGALAIAHAFERDLREMAWRLADWRDCGSSDAAQAWLM